MIGTWRNVLPEVCIIESRPEYAKENYRLARSICFKSQCPSTFTI